MHMQTEIALGTLYGHHTSQSHFLLAQSLGSRFNQQETAALTDKPLFKFQGTA